MWLLGMYKRSSQQARAAGLDVLRVNVDVGVAVRQHLRAKMTVKDRQHVKG
jgi:hypothetical protein